MARGRYISIVSLYCLNHLILIQLVLRVQFLEAKVNHDRWAEEVELVRQELLYTMATFDYLHKYWKQRSFDATPGAAAYAHRMANMYTSMAMQIAQKIPE